MDDSSIASRKEEDMIILTKLSEGSSLFEGGKRHGVGLKVPYSTGSLGNK